MKLYEFQKTWETEGKNPIGVVKLFLNAVLAYEEDQEIEGFMVSYLIPEED